METDNNRRTEIVETLPRGYENIYVPEPVRTIPIRSTSENYDQAFYSWSSITECPKCGGKVFKYVDASNQRYYAQCEEVHNSIYKEIESMCKGQIYQPPSRAKNQGETPLSSVAKNIDEYINMVQVKLCKWHIVL